MPRVELLWWEGCPSYERARELVEAVLREEGVEAAVEMVEVTTNDDAERERFVGSPTIRIDGREVAPEDGQPAGLACRVYKLRDGRISPTPDPEDVRDAIRAAVS